MTLREVLEAAAEAIGAEATTAPDGAVVWRRDGREFAELDAAGRAASFRLDDVLASAAQRTPDTASSPRGDPWVTFAPSSIDAHAVDRAHAWFLAAERRAGRDPGR